MLTTTITVTSCSYFTVWLSYLRCCDSDTGCEVEQVLKAYLDHPSQALLKLDILRPLQLCHIRHLRATHCCVYVPLL